jgi:hypothetical protein
MRGVENIILFHSTKIENEQDEKQAVVDRRKPRKTFDGVRNHVSETSVLYGTYGRQNAINRTTGVSEAICLSACPWKFF